MGHFSCSQWSRGSAKRERFVTAKHRAINLMSREKRVDEEGEKEIREEEGLSPNGLRNVLVGPCHAPFMVTPVEARATISADPSSFPRTKRMLLHSPCVIGVRLQADLRHACPLQNFRSLLLSRSRVPETQKRRSRLEGLIEFIHFIKVADCEVLLFRHPQERVPTSHISHRGHYFSPNTARPVRQMKSGHAATAL